MFHAFEHITSTENLLQAWWEFLRGKRDREDVSVFSLRLSDNIAALRRDLVCGTYRHGGYRTFRVVDPKPRQIHVASVRDRLVHRALHRILAPLFERRFIADSCSCQTGKGTHRALDRFRRAILCSSKNHTRTAWVLQFDIRKCFANIDHETLLTILRVRTDQNTQELLRVIIQSFSSGRSGIGLPLGNLTSQLLVNVYLHELDWYLKQTLRVPYYIRYADDIVIIFHDRTILAGMIPVLQHFLTRHLKLDTHKNSLRTIASGVDFLGWVHFPDHRVLRTVTKRRMLRRIMEHHAFETLQSYRGLLQHGNARMLEQRLIVADRVVADPVFP